MKERELETVSVHFLDPLGQPTTVWYTRSMGTVQSVVGWVATHFSIMSSVEGPVWWYTDVSGFTRGSLNRFGPGQIVLTG